jgi:PAS domain S-box-containing protein
MESVLLIQTEPTLVSALVATESPSIEFLSLSAEDALDKCKSTDKVIAAVLGKEIQDPIQLSQRLHLHCKNLSIIILSEQSAVADIQRSIRFTPFIGNRTSCIADTNQQTILPFINDCIERSRKQLESKMIHSHLNEQLHYLKEQKTSTTIPSKEYVGRLFDYAPIGIITLDFSGRILALNKSASGMLGVSEKQGISRNISQLLPELQLNASQPHEVIKTTEDKISYFEATVTSISTINKEEGYLLMLVDVTKRKQYEADLEKAIIARDNFLSLASHELKTPLTSLKLQIQLRKRRLERGKEKLSQTEKLLLVTQEDEKQVDRIIRLVDDMLDISRINSGKIKLNKTSVSLVELMEDIVSGLVLQGEQLGNQIIFKNPKEEILVDCDAFKLEQVITNIINNAFKYAPGKPIEIKISASKTSTDISIADQGPGIELKDQLRIFNQFERVTTETSVAGLGLGLYICQQIVQAHHGQLRVKSTAGEGAEFIVSLPHRRD